MGNTSISVAQFVFFPVKGDFAMTLAEKLQELFVSTALGQSLWKTKIHIVLSYWCICHQGQMRKRPAGAAKLRPVANVCQLLTPVQLKPSSQTTIPRQQHHISHQTLHTEFVF